MYWNDLFYSKGSNLQFSTFSPSYRLPSLLSFCHSQILVTLMFCTVIFFILAGVDNQCILQLFLVFYPSSPLSLNPHSFPSPFYLPIYPASLYPDPLFLSCPMVPLLIHRGAAMILLGRGRNVLKLLFQPILRQPKFRVTTRSSYLEARDDSLFLDASSHLYNRLCPSVCLSVGNAFIKNIKIKHFFQQKRGSDPVKEAYIW